MSRDYLFQVETEHPEILSAIRRIAQRSGWKLEGNAIYEVLIFTKSGSVYGNNRPSEDFGELLTIPTAVECILKGPPNLQSKVITVAGREITVDTSGDIHIGCTTIKASEVHRVITEIQEFLGAK